MQCLTIFVLTLCWRSGFAVLHNGNVTAAEDTVAASGTVTSKAGYAGLEQSNAVATNAVALGYRYGGPAHQELWSKQQQHQLDSESEPQSQPEPHTLPQAQQLTAAYYYQPPYPHYANFYLQRAIPTDLTMIPPAHALKFYLPSNRIVDAQNSKDGGYHTKIYYAPKQPVAAAASATVAAQAHIDSNHSGSSSNSNNNHNKDRFEGYHYAQPQSESTRTVPTPYYQSHVAAAQDQTLSSKALMTSALVQVQPPKLSHYFQPNSHPQYAAQIGGNEVASQGQIINALQSELKYYKDANEKQQQQHQQQQQQSLPAETDHSNEMSLDSSAHSEQPQYSQQTKFTTHGDEPGGYHYQHAALRTAALTHAAFNQQHYFTGSTPHRPSADNAYPTPNAPSASEQHSTQPQQPNQQVRPVFEQSSAEQHHLPTDEFIPLGRFANQYDSQASTNFDYPNQPNYLTSHTPQQLYAGDYAFRPKFSHFPHPLPIPHSYYASASQPLQLPPSIEAQRPASETPQYAATYKGLRHYAYVNSKPIALAENFEPISPVTELLIDERLPTHTASSAHAPTPRPGYVAGSVSGFDYLQMPSKTIELPAYITRLAEAPNQPTQAHKAFLPGAPPKSFFPSSPRRPHSHYGAPLETLTPRNAVNPSRTPISKQEFYQHTGVEQQQQPQLFKA